MRFSQLFKVDGKKDTYFLRYSFNTWEVQYWMTKTDKGWKIVMISQWIS